MNEPTAPDLVLLKSKLAPSVWEKRLRAAAEHGAVCARIVAAMEGERIPLGEAIRKVCPGAADATWRDRVERFREGGEEGLVDRRFVEADEKVTDAVKLLIRGIVLARPGITSHEVADLLTRQTGTPIAASTIRPFLGKEGLSRPEGRPPGTRIGKAPKVEPLGCAGAELLKAVAVESGAVQALTRALGEALEALPAPDPALVVDDRANRDDHGRFLPEYNAGQARGDAEVGPRFGPASERRKKKDLREMHVAKVSEAVLFRKVLSMVMLPAVIASPRWEALSNWQGAHLGPLVGYPYQAETLDKFLRELKLAGVSSVLRDAVAQYWIGRQEPVSGAVLLYADTSVKPLWTHTFMRSAKVSKLGGRVMPATSTVSLHAGCGTPVIYRSFSGHVSLPKEVPKLLAEYEAVAGEGSAQRVMILDREAHAVWLFKELAASNWSYVIPLCSSVTGPNARFEDLGDWVPYKGAGDEVREGRLLLRDSRAGELSLWVRVVARRRHRTKKVAWFATNTEISLFDAPAVIDHYFARWPLQEHVFRDGAGMVGLDVHHGFGRAKIENVAVISGIEKLDARIRKLDAETAAAAPSPTTDRPSAAQIAEYEEWNRAARAKFDADVEAGRGATKAVRQRHRTLRTLEAWLEEQRTAKTAVEAEEKSRAEKAAKRAATRANLVTERDQMAGRREIYTIDVELDEVMTAFKLTFMNLCREFMRTCLGGEHVELETLIRAVFSLPGERVRTEATEVIRIWRQPRDRRFMPLVERACRELTERGLLADGRRLSFELADQPGSALPTCRAASKGSV